MDLMSATQRYTNTLKSLSASNEMLDTKIKELRSNTLRLRLDLMKFQRHMNGFNREFLVTWQADTLTRLIEVIYEGHGWRLPGGVTSRDHGVVNRERMSMMYGIAARKLKKETLRALGLYERYYEALQKYDEVCQLPFRGLGSDSHNYRSHHFEAQIRFNRNVVLLDGWYRRRTLRSRCIVSGGHCFRCAMVGRWRRRLRYSSLSYFWVGSLQCSDGRSLKIRISSS